MNNFSIKNCILLWFCGFFDSTFSSGIDFSNIYTIEIFVTPKGLPYPIGRIVGGKTAKPHTYPYQVALHFDSKIFCGGSLITQNYVLTAAHCASGRLEVKIILGAQNIKNQEDTQVILISKEIIVHAEWNMTTLKADIALIKLPQSVTINNNIKTVKLATVRDSFKEKTAVLTGWGRRWGILGGLSSELQEADVIIINNDACRKTYGNIITDEILCTIGIGKGSCRGDSGGPLVVGGMQVGIVSFGASFCSTGYPSGYTRVASYYQWIVEHSDLHE